MTRRGNFILEGQIKQHSNSATKEIFKAKIWQRISRSIDTVEKIIENAEQNIKITNMNAAEIAKIISSLNSNKGFLPKYYTL